MSRKLYKSGYKMFDAVSIAVSQTSAATNVETMDIASILVEWSAGATPVGVLTVQARHKENSTWNDLDMGAPINITGNSGSHLLILEELPFRDIRLVYTSTSGSATLDATLVHKTVGA